MMNANRAKLNIVKETTKEVFSPAPLDMDKRPKSMNKRRKDIIEDKPKAKIVREYFQDLSARLSQYSDDEEI